MTKNQIEFWKVREQVRANQAAEEEKHRANIAQEQQAANELGFKDIQFRTSQAEAERSNLAKETETARHNKAVETETQRHNIKEELHKVKQLGQDQHQFSMDLVPKAINTLVNVGKLGTELVGSWSKLGTSPINYRP